MADHDEAAFRAELADGGFQVATKTMAPSMVLDGHSHDFHVRALVTAGEISITVDGDTRRYGVGDLFTMDAGRVHSESVGPRGVTFVVGRRAP
ncbi:MAG: cupin [Hyphomicrobiales bacterium]|nr:cupin [Hyphomicrobiales bacterium]MCP5373186.1 cupin [Hyphomicrobiales bacterium]